MNNLNKTIASVFGIGFIKGGGSIAAAVTGLFWFWLQADGKFNLYLLPVTVLITALGVWVSNKVEADWGSDSSKVVIDEVAGMCISLLFVPVTIKYVIIGFVLFRFNDIVKPLFIKKAEALPGGWGVMADDVLAGVFANIILQMIVYIN
jgi:phosphatidylglycerophosphatase A